MSNLGLIGNFMKANEVFDGLNDQMSKFFFVSVMHLICDLNLIMEI